MIKKAVISIVILIVATAFLYFTRIGCVWNFLFNIRCLGCGMTRALICLFKGDISGAFSYHGMFWSLPIIYLYYLFDGKLFKNKILNISVIVAIAVGFIINYFR